MRSPGPDGMPRASLADAPRSLRYAVASLTILVAFGATLLVERAVPEFVGDLFYLAIGSITWFLGPDAALLSLVLAVPAVAYLTPPTPFPSVDDVLYMTLFVATALAMLHLSRMQRAARGLAEVRAREAF